MANTTFNGPVRSENGFQRYKQKLYHGHHNRGSHHDGPVSLADANVTLANGATTGAGFFLFQTVVKTTHTLCLRLLRGQCFGLFTRAVRQTARMRLSLPLETPIYIGGVTFLDTDNEVSAVFSDGNSNSSIQINVPAGFDVTIVGLNTTNYQIFGTVTGATAPAFADQ